MEPCRLQGDEHDCADASSHLRPLLEFVESCAYDARDMSPGSSTPLCPHLERTIPMGAEQSLRSAGREAMRVMNFTEAITCFTGAIALRPDDPRVHTARSTAFASIRDWTSSREDASRAIQLEPENIKAHFNYARACLVLRDLDAARLGISRGLACNPHHPDLVKLSVDIFDAVDLADRGKDSLYAAITSSNTLVDPIVTTPLECGDSVGEFLAAHSMAESNPFVHSPVVPSTPNPSPPTKFF